MSWFIKYSKLDSPHCMGPLHSAIYIANDIASLSGFPRHIKSITLYLTSPFPEYYPVSSRWSCGGIGLIKCGYSLIFRQTCDNVAGCIATSSLSSTNGDFKGGAGPLLQTKPGICVYIIRLPACTRLVHVPISKSY